VVDKLDEQRDRSSTYNILFSKSKQGQSKKPTEPICAFVDSLFDK
jgi:hypothetical protein